MKRSRVFIIIVIIIFTIMFDTSCDSLSEVQKYDEVIVSDSAIRYSYPVENIFRYEGVIIDNDFIIYIFGKSSELAISLNKNENMKVWTEYYNDSKRKNTNDWRLIENSEDWYLVIYCDVKNYDLDAGIAISNCFESDGITVDYNIKNINNFYIRYLETPELRKQQPNQGIAESSQIYWYGKWSELSEQSTVDWNP